MHKAVSLHGTAETNNTVKEPYPNKFFLIKRKNGKEITEFISKHSMYFC